MSEKPEVGLYIDGWRPEPAVREVAQQMLEIIFSDDATDIDCRMALNTLWEAVDPLVFAENTRRLERELFGVEPDESGVIP